MKINETSLKAALAGVLLTVAGASVNADAAPKGKEKCHGVAKKAHNDCGTSKHGCGGKAKKNYDPEEWMYVKKGTCESLQKKLIAKGLLKMDMKKLKNMKKNSKKMGM